MRVVSAAWVNELAPPANEQVAPSAVGGQPSSLVFGHTAEKVVRSYAISDASLNSLSAKNIFRLPLDNHTSRAAHRLALEIDREVLLGKLAVSRSGRLHLELRSDATADAKATTWVSLDVLSENDSEHCHGFLELCRYLFARQSLEYGVTVSGQSIDESFARLRTVPIAARLPGCT